MDINILQQLLNKLDSYPSEIQFYFHSSSAGKTLSELRKKYQPTNPDLFFELLNGCLLNDFNLSFAEQKLKGELPEDKIKPVIVDFIGMALLPLAKYIEQVDIVKELSRRGGVVASYVRYEQDFEGEMEDVKLNVVEKILNKYDKDLDKDGEMRDAIDLFKNDLMAVLGDENVGRLVGLNGMLVYLLLNHPSFKRELEGAILENAEILTSQKFSLMGSISQPTVANWVRDFISKYGTAIFNNLILSEYITKAENTKGLEQKEKNAVAKLLVLYRNLKFFPEPFANLPQERWHIIPIEHLLPRTLPQAAQSRPKSVPVSGPDFSRMSPIELKGFMEANNLSKADVEKMTK